MLRDCWTTSRPLAASRTEQLSRLEPCVIMGRGHSGTRLISWICTHLGFQLGADESIHRSGDITDRAFKQHVRRVAQNNLDPDRVARMDAKDLNRFQKAVFGFHQRLAPSSSRWGWKFPETYMIGPYVERTFPRARYIHLLRDGRDIAFKRHLTDSPQHRLGDAILVRQQARSLPPHLQSALSWSLQVELFCAFRAQVDPARILDIRFEALARDPVREVERICEFLDVSMTNGCDEFLHTIDRAKISQHRKEDPARLREVERRIASTLKKTGYL